MSQTVWGVAAKVDELVRHVDDWGRLSSIHTVRDDPNLEIRDLVRAELDPDGRLLCVAVLDDGLVDEGRWYYSPTTSHTGTIWGRARSP